MMSNKKHFFSAALAVFVLVACASEQAADVKPPVVASMAEPIEKPSFSASQTETITAVVQSIDYDTREVTLIDDIGDELTFVAGDTVRNLRQVSVGDVLVAEHVETVDIKLLPGDGLGADQAELIAIVRAQEGELPGGIAVDSRAIVMVVKAINLDDETFILEGPDGTLQEYVSMNPENLKLAEVGDIVVMTITESFAIAVEKSE